MLRINRLNTHQRSTSTKNTEELLKMYEDADMGTIIKLNIDANKIYTRSYG